MRNEAPLYSKIAADLLEQIRSGHLAIGAFLPTETELQEHYGVSRHTIRAAMRVLSGDGLIRSTSGVGTYVTATPAQRVESWTTGRDLLAHARNSRQKITAVEEVDAVDGADPFKWSGWSEKRWLRVAILRYAKKESSPYTLSELYIDKRFGGIVRKNLTVGAEGDFRRPVFELIAKTYGVQARRIDQSITAVPTPKYIARVLGSKVNAPALRVIRCYLEEDGRPIELTINHFLGESFTYTSMLRIGDE